jgi:hypothetical protein
LEVNYKGQSFIIKDDEFTIGDMIKLRVFRDALLNWATRLFVASEFNSGISTSTQKWAESIAYCLVIIKQGLTPGGETTILNKATLARFLTLKGDFITFISSEYEKNRQPSDVINSDDAKKK